ncbi:GTPase IMAP family member 8-like [Colossoma macropomum]|uniref:GTPase IMAP family member 8-like n=1 Tax=Colossoma macropomum TaxID=42526 RepID=UPI001863F3EE|nr:GTPase IMAP family member 8-like [Colossoma macropomum]
MAKPHPHGSVAHGPELRAVVFGGKFAGKTTLINAVFGEGFLPNQKRTAQCKKLRGNVCGRELMLVDTPGWWKHFPLSDTANFLKKELIQGVSLCHPGPHVILLVIEIDIPFTEKHRKAAVDHLALLGDQIWTHTLVLFTRSRSLGNRTIEEHIEKEGEALKWLIEKCGNRYHVFDSTVSDKTSQVTELLEKIEDIVRINDGAHFQIEAKILEEAAEWKRTVMTRAKSRELKQRERLDKEELRIALLGWVIAGKSSAGNTILDKKVFVTDQSTLECQSGCGEVDGRPVTVLDTPSWFKYFPAQYTPAWIKSGIFNGVFQTVTPPHCILLVIPADTSFHEEQRKVIEENMSLLGEQVWRHTIVLFTWGDILGDVTIEQHIESEGEALQWVVEKCDNRYHIFNNEDRRNRVQVTELLQKIDQLMAQNSSFQLNAEMFGGIHAKQEEDAQTETTDEYNLQDIVRFVDEEWRRRDKEFLKRVSKVKKDIKAVQRGDASLEFPPDLSETRLNTETEDHTDEKVSQTEPESRNVGTVQDEAKSTLKLKDQIKEMLDREWSRREEALMGRFQEMLSDQGWETQSEPTDDDKERSKIKVSHWFRDCSEGYGSAQGSVQSE